MKIKIANVSWDSSSSVQRDISVLLEKSLNLLFDSECFGAGIDQFTAVSVSVSSDPIERDKFCRAYDKVGIFKSQFDDKKIKYISFALPFNPEHIELMSGEQYKKAFCESLIERLDNPNIKIPKLFNYHAFSQKMKSALQLLSVSKFSA